MHIGNYINMMHKSAKDLAKAFKLVAAHHGDEPDVSETCHLLASWSEEMNKALAPFTKKYSQNKNNEPDRLMRTLFKEPRKGSMGLLRDLQDLWLMTNEAEVCCIILRQAGSGLHDKELISVCNMIEERSKRQSSWLLTRMKTSATQTLIVA
jgi:hypothetical protein